MYLLTSQPEVPLLSVFANSVLANSMNRGRRLDKHGKPRRVYELNHTSLMSQYNDSIDFKHW